MLPSVLSFLGSLIRLLFIAASAWFLLLSISNIVWLRLSSRKPR